MGDSGFTLLDAQDLYLFNEGSHLRLWEKLGAHPLRVDGVDGVHFAVWAPNAERVSAIGDWNGWDGAAHPLRIQASSGIWSGFVPGVARGARYKYRIESRGGAFRADKTDPFAFHCEVSPDTASIVWTLEHEWRDAEWMATRRGRNAREAPIAIYELHIGSWRRVPHEGWRSLSYRELADVLPEYVAAQGFTHVELLPVMEHPFFGSWGYQTTGYFAPTSRYGTPQDFMYLVDSLHRAGIGVILDWVPSHFPSDAHGLGFFDGTHLYEHGDPRQGFHPDWKSHVFNYGRHEVRSFLASSALYWLELYHADGLRVDAVASMLYLDYSRKPGEWVPNEYGGRENLQAIGFLRRLNAEVYKSAPDVQTYAEESTSWPLVSRPTHEGGLGFGFKWDMGWMHDSLQYFAHDPVHRGFHHGNLTFRMLYAWSENFVLPLSHDEVVHLKKSLLGKMPGDDWSKFANLRLLLGAQYTQPGKKLLFMGAELAQWGEWNHDGSLDWSLLGVATHSGVQRWVRDLNTAYRAEPALHARDCDPAGFAWIDCNDAAQSSVAFVRRGGNPEQVALVVCNFTPVPRGSFRVGVPSAGFWREILNGDAALYGGSGIGNLGGVRAQPVVRHGQSHSIQITLPPLAIVVFKLERS
ncbi:MAG: 1,4-alpha-glucan branching protein GlgB [Myxococcota bacterium]